MFECFVANKLKIEETSDGKKITFSGQFENWWGAEKRQSIGFSAQAGFNKIFFVFNRLGYVPSVKRKRNQLKNCGHKGIHVNELSRTFSRRV